MPDLLLVFSRWWKMIIGLTILATVITLVVSLLIPKEYLSTATALPANGAMADKSSIFNNNIEVLYSEFGTTDDLDRLEGTGKLDTIYLAAANQFKLADHYKIHSPGDGQYKAAMRLKKHTDISKSGYGELKIKVWDSEPAMAADICNYLLQTIQSIHQKLQSENNTLVLDKLKSDYKWRQNASAGNEDSSKRIENRNAPAGEKEFSGVELIEYRRLISQYEVALKTNAPVLLVVEHGHPSPWADKPDVVLNVSASFFAALIFSVLLSVFMESRKVSD
jgi:capsular polysaccharide biosynthesis protein